MPDDDAVRASHCAARSGAGVAERSHFDGGASMEISNDVDAVARKVSTVVRAVIVISLKKN